LILRSIECRVADKRHGDVVLQRGEGMASTATMASPTAPPDPSGGRSPAARGGAVADAIEAAKTAEAH
jgi:hypothetical protein